MGFNAKAYLKYFGFDRINDTGENIQASCPDFYNMHHRGDKRPSWGIHKKTGLSNCFRCKINMNIEQLTAKLLTQKRGEKVDPYTAWVWLDEKGWVPEEVSDINSIKDKIMEIKDGKAQIKGIDEAILEEFHNGIHRSVVQRGISPEMAKEWGLRFDKKSRRTIIPVYTRNDSLLGVLSRATSKNDYITHAVGVPRYDEEAGERKVIHKFKKKLVLFGENKFAGKEKLLVIESPLDVIYAWSHGLQKEYDIGALMGTAYSRIQISKMTDYPEVILALDNDKYGKKAMRGITKELSGKVRLYTFNNLGHNDLGDLKPDELFYIKEEKESQFKDYSEKLGSIKRKILNRGG